MRRIGRYILNGLTVLSLVLCVASCVLWVRSYSAPYWSTWGSEVVSSSTRFAWHDLELVAMRGQVGALRLAFDAKCDPESPYAEMYARMFQEAAPRRGWHKSPGDGVYGLSPPALRNGFGFHLSHRHDTIRLVTGEEKMGAEKYAPWISEEERAVSVPCWFVLVAAGALPLRCVFRANRRRLRRKDGRCALCGYDLRATPDRCPECGTIPTKVKA